MIDNEHRVGVRTWKRWDERARAAFNATYDTLRNNQWACKHPKTTTLPTEEWETLAWNAAWLAADASAKLKDS